MGRSDEILANRPSATGGEASGPLGVPGDFVATRTPRPHAGEGYGVLAPGAGIAVAPRYFDGDEWQPAMLSPEERAELQSMMRAAGVFGRDARFRLGIWDDTSRAAYRELLSFANASGLTVQQALQEYRRATEAFPEQEELPKFRVTNPIDLRSVFERIGQATVGKRVDPAQIDQWIQAYQQLEIGAQRAEIDEENPFMIGSANVTDLWNAERNRVVVGAPDPAAFAEQRARAADPEGAFGQDVMERMNEFFSLLDGPVDGVPSPV